MAMKLLHASGYGMALLQGLKHNLVRFEIQAHQILMNYFVFACLLGFKGSVKGFLLFSELANFFHRREQIIM